MLLLKQTNIETLNVMISKLIRPKSIPSVQNTMIGFSFLVHYLMDFLQSRDHAIFLLSFQADHIFVEAKGQPSHHDV